MRVQVVAVAPAVQSVQALASAVLHDGACARQHARLLVVFTAVHVGPTLLGAAFLVAWLAGDLSTQAGSAHDEFSSHSRVATLPGKQVMVAVSAAWSDSLA